MHSPEQQRKKDIARNEAIDHAHYANVMHPRAGKDHEDHKLSDLNHESSAEEAMEHGHSVRGY